MEESKEMEAKQKEILEKYGETKMFFDYYYKYDFMYVSEGGDIHLATYTNADDIYHPEFYREMTLKDLLITVDWQVRITKGSKEIYNYYDYNKF